MSERRRLGVPAGAAADDAAVNVQVSTNCVARSDAATASAGITRWTSGKRILIKTPSPYGCTLGSMYAAIHSPSLKRRIALRAVLWSPGSGSSVWRSPEPETMYLLTLVGTKWDGVGFVAA